MEQIILAPGLSGNALLRSLAMRGIKCFNIRVFSAYKLARTALLRSGIAVKENFVNGREAAAIVAEAVGKAGAETYFGKTTYSDIRAITAAINRMRGLAGGGDEEPVIREALGKGEFREKNEALLAVYMEYMHILSERNAVDRVSLIRKAVQECRPLDAELTVLEEYPLNPLEQALYETLSGRKYTERRVTALQDLFIAGGRKSDEKEYAYNIESFKNCYGAPNEVETILDDIYKDKQPDKCIVAVTDAVTYGQLFFDYSMLYDIPVTFGCGIPITNSNPARLLALYYRWKNEGFFGVDAVTEMLTSEAFDRSKLAAELQIPEEGFSWNKFYKMVGALRLSTDKEVNGPRLEAYKTAVGKDEELGDKEAGWKKQLIPYLERVSRVLSLPAEEFIKQYSYIREEGKEILWTLDKAAVRTIEEELGLIRKSGMSADEPEDIIQDILKRMICRQNREEGRLHVTTIARAVDCLRENLYIAGLSASSYPGSPKEDYLLLDKDIRNFGKQGTEYVTSDGRIERKKMILKKVVHLATLLGAKIHVSYSGLDVSELKKDNASSLVFELLYRNKGTDKKTISGDWENDIPKEKYFEPAVSITRKIGEAFNGDTDNKKRFIMPSQPESREPVKAWGNLEKEYSPTELGKFYECPRRFMLKTILGIKEPEENDPFEVISALDKGNLAHKLMERLANSNMQWNDFRQLACEYFDRYVAETPPLVKGYENRVRNDFLKMMETAYIQDPKRETVMSEEKESCVHKDTGINLKGYPDRVEKLPDGTCVVVDFKTGKKIESVNFETGKNKKQKEDDIDTCLQVILYAYMMENSQQVPDKITITRGEYRYIKGNETVTCRYDKNMKEELRKKLETFKKCMDNGDFPQTTNLEACKYCKYTGICE